MAGPYYVRSTDGDDASDGSTWALAKATLAGAFAIAAAGDTIYVSDNHAETQASAMALTSPGTAAAPVKIICGDDSAEPPTALATTGTISTTGASSITFQGFAYVYGITFAAGNSTANASLSFVSANPWLWKFEDSKLVLDGSSSSGRINFGTTATLATDCKILLKNTPLQFASTSQFIAHANCIVEWTNTTSAIQGSVPTSLFTPGAKIAGRVKVAGVDLSAAGSGKNLVAATNSSTSQFDFINCKLGASVAVLSGAIAGQGGLKIRLHNCDSSDTNYRMEEYCYEGSIKSETSKIRSGGASDGTTAISWNMTSLAVSSFISPLESPSFAIWNDTTGSSKTVTVEIAQDSAATALTESEIWLEVEYLGTSGYPVSSFATDHNSTLLSASGTAQTTSSVTWDNMTDPTKQKLACTFTPQEKGYFICRVMLAKASTTVYVDPIATVS